LFGPQTADAKCEFGRYFAETAVEDAQQHLGTFFTHSFLPPLLPAFLPTSLQPQVKPFFQNRVVPG